LEWWLNYFDKPFKAIKPIRNNTDESCTPDAFRDPAAAAERRPPGVDGFEAAFAAALR